MGRTAVSLLFIFLFSAVSAQETIQPTSQVIVKGAVAKELSLTWNDIQQRKAQSIPDLVITNHLGETKSIYRQMKGVLLKDLLAGVQISAPSPKQLSEYYLVLEASDGYRVVYSWNELFNSATGDHVFVVTEKEGKPVDDPGGKILAICNSDLRTGRRTVKGLSTISIHRID